MSRFRITYNIPNLQSPGFLQKDIDADQHEYVQDRHAYVFFNGETPLGATARSNFVAEITAIGLLFIEIITSTKAL